MTRVSLISRHATAVGYQKSPSVNSIEHAHCCIICPHIQEHGHVLKVTIVHREDVITRNALRGEIGGSCLT